MRSTVVWFGFASVRIQYFRGLECAPLSCDLFFPFVIPPVGFALSKNPIPELGIGSVMLWHEAVAKLSLEFTQLLKPFVPRTIMWLRLEINTIERSNALRCQLTFLSFLVQLAVVALLRNPIPEREVCRILAWHETVAELNLELTELLKSFTPRKSLGYPPFGSNILELSKSLRCHATWLSFLIQLIVVALSRYPPTELGVGSVLMWHEVVAELCLKGTQLFTPFVPRTSIWLSLEINTLERSNMLRCHGTCFSLMVQLTLVALFRNPSPELGVGSVLLWHEAVTELHLEFTQLFKPFVPTGSQISITCPPYESNILELLNTLRCHGTWYSFLIQLVLGALLGNPLPELRTGNVVCWHEAVTEVCLVFTQLLKSFVPISSQTPFETDTIECPDVLSYHTSWFYFLVLPVSVIIALKRNPWSELGVGRIIFRHKTVTELFFVFTQLSEELTPFRVTQSSIIVGSLKNRCIETWLVLVLALSVSSLMRPLFGLLFFALAHSEYLCRCEARLKLDDLVLRVYRM